MNKSIVAGALGSMALVAVFTLSGGSAASAVAPTSAPTAAPATTAPESCWVDATTQESLCVPTGENLIAAVLADDNIAIDVPVGTDVSGVDVSVGELAQAQLSVASPDTVEPVSIIYDDINYGGGSLIMSSDDGCDAAISSLVPYGWNDRASSFKSYNGCVTALYQNINYDGTHVGYDSSLSSFGSQND